MTTNNINNRYFFADSIATLLAIREAEQANEEAVRLINALLDRICDGIDDLSEVKEVLSNLYALERCTNAVAVDPWAFDDIENPWENEFTDIEEKILKVQKELLGEEPVAPALVFTKETFGAFASDDELPW